MNDKHDKYGPGGPNSPNPYVPDHERKNLEGKKSDRETEGTPLRQAVIELRERNPDMTQRQIAHSAGCSEEYVSEILREQEERTQSGSQIFGVDPDVNEPDLPGGGLEDGPLLPEDAPEWQQIVLLIVLLLSLLIFVVPNIELLSVFVV